MKSKTLLILSASVSLSLAGTPEKPCNPQRDLHDTNRTSSGKLDGSRTNADFINPVERTKIPGIPSHEAKLWRDMNPTHVDRNSIDAILAKGGTGAITQNYADVNLNRVNSADGTDLDSLRVPTEKRDYSLFNPTPNHLLRELSPDRPDATESPLTVDAGRFALEASIFDYRRDNGTETYTYGSLNFKAGLSHNTDLQTVVDLYTDSDDGYGFGDVTFRLKWNLWGNDGGDSALALMPFVKIPTGTELSNDEWEGGLIVPWGTSLTDTIGLGLMAEVDYVFNEDDGDHELEFLHTAVLGFDLTEKAGAYLEYIGIAGEDAYQAYIAGGMNYAVNDHLILDFGLQGGLNSDSEDFGFFTGFTKRF